MPNVSVTKAAEILGVTAEHTRRLINQKKVTARKFGHAWMVDEASVKKYGARKKVERSSPTRLLRQKLACQIFSRLPPSHEINDLILALRLCFRLRLTEIQSLICSWNEDLDHDHVVREIERVCDGR